MISPLHNLCGLFVNEFNWHQKKLSFFSSTKQFLNQGKNIFEFISSFKSVCFSSTMGQIYAEHKDEDSFLYIAYGGENTFG
jgi:hypothetical protein